MIQKPIPIGITMPLEAEKLMLVSKEPARAARAFLNFTIQSAPAPDLSTFWGKVLQNGWINPSHGRIVVRAGRSWFSPLVKQTALSLVEYLSQKMPETQPTYLVIRFEPATSRLELSEKDRLSKDSLGWRARGCCLQDGVPLSNVWFAPFSSITVTGAGPEDQLRHSSVLSAQAEMIVFSPARIRAFKRECISEAHRLWPAAVL